MKTIPFLDIKDQDSFIRGEIKYHINKVLESGTFVAGEETSKLERRWAQLNGVRACSLVSSGTAGLELVLRGLDIENKNIITTPASFIATSSAISVTNNNPVFIDTDETCNLDLDLTEERLKKGDIAAVLFVALYGNPLNQIKLQEICKKYGVYCIGDLCQAHGSEYNGLPIAKYTDAAVFSFYVSKTISTLAGESGAVVSDDEELIEKIQSLKNHGRSNEIYQHSFVGTNARAGEISASIINVKLDYLDHYYEKRIEAAALYNSNFDNLDVILKETPNSKIVRYIYNIFVDKREELMFYLKNQGINCAIHYPNLIPLTDAYKYLNYSGADFPNAFKQANATLSLPFWSGISNDIIAKVSENIKSFLSL